MTTRATKWLPATVFLAVTCLLGLWVLPKFDSIFADMLPGEPLPWMTRLVLSAGGAGYVVLAIFGATVILVTDSLRRTHWTYGVLVVLLAFALGFTTVALFWPLMILVEQAV
jgi:type II secretory pathway component PulF